MLKTGQIQDVSKDFKHFGKNIAAMHNPNDVLPKLLCLKQELTESKRLIFYYCSYSYQLGPILIFLTSILSMGFSGRCWRSLLVLI